jgi:predicted nucleic acid-binding protein
LRGIVLADTGPLYAARDRDDTHHSRAHDELLRLQAENLKVVVPYPILLESYSLVLRKLGSGEAHALLAEVTSTAILTNATTEDYRDASVTILPYRDQDLTLFDTVLAAMSDRLEAPVWTFDHHFDVLRVGVWR